VSRSLRRHSLGSASPTRRRSVPVPIASSIQTVQPAGDAIDPRASRIGTSNLLNVSTSASTSILARKVPAVRARFSYCNPTPPSRAGTRLACTTNAVSGSDSFPRRALSRRHTRPGGENHRVAVPVPSVQAAAARKSAPIQLLPTRRLLGKIPRRWEGALLSRSCHELSVSLKGLNTDDPM
jgi:hypothetical protein